MQRHEQSKHQNCNDINKQKKYVVTTQKKRKQLNIYQTKNITVTT